MLFSYRYFYLSSIAWLLIFTLDSMAFELERPFDHDKKLVYHHWNTNDKKVTGFTEIEFDKSAIKDGSQFKETWKNMKKDRTLFSQKMLFFDASSGRLLQYEEKDLRSSSQIIDSYDQSQIQTKIIKGEQEKNFTLQNQKDLIPFEVIHLALRKNLSTLLEKKSWEFVLYLPALAFELEKSGLPMSMSKIRMRAEVEKTGPFQTPMGEKQAVWLQVRPTSFLIKSLLPEKRTRFGFVYLIESPRYLLMFEEDRTQTVLIDLVQKE